MSGGQEIELWAELNVHSGKDEAFKGLVKEMIAQVRDNEPGCTRYEWFLSNDLRQCRISELYVDSAALVAHFQGRVLTDFAPKLLEISDLVRLEIHGQPSEQAMAAVAGFGAVIFSRLSGLSR